ncbi:MAG TPA: hypothetical protein VFN30_14910 [Chitinophagaceae bacterium]|nr:hypothetical protein [Chitinophagaceae bacterium]
MTSKDLNEYFKGRSAISDLKKTIEKDVANYTNAFKLKGSTISLNFAKNEKINLDASKLKMLIEAAITGKMSSPELSYLCDCLALAENVNYSNDNLLDIVYSIADPEINGGFKSIVELQEMLANLK